MTNETKPDLIEITGGHYQHRNSIAEFFKRFEAAIRDGYTLHPAPAVRQLPILAGRPSCTLVTLERAAEITQEIAERNEKNIAAEAEQAVAVDVPVDDESTDVEPQQDEPVDDSPVGDEPVVEYDKELIDALDKATTKDQLLKIAKTAKVEVPSDKKQPAAIKKFLLEIIK